MCSYCGCEAETVVAKLMSDHGIIADLSYRVSKAMDDGHLEQAARLVAELAAVFTSHSLEEEAGLFTQLRLAGEANLEVEGLVDDHRRLRAALSEADAASDPAHLRRLLDDLARHAQIEDTDLFPFAMQQLPDARWSALSASTPS